MKQKSKVVKNYIFNTSYQLLAIIVPLITTPYISRTLGADGIGINSYTYSIVSYFVIFSVLGTATYGNKQIGILQENPVGRSRKFWDILTLRVLISGGALVLYTLYVILFAKYKSIAFIQIFYLFAALCDTAWFFQGMEDFRRVAVRNYAIKLLNVAAIFIFIHSREDLWKYVLMLAGLTFLGNLSIIPYLKKYLVNVRPYKPQPFTDFGVIVQLFIPAMALQMYEMLDKTMIGVITQDAAQNGYYEQSNKIVKMALILVTAINTVLLPKSSKAFAEGKIDEMNDYLYKSYRFVWFLGIPLMCGIIGTASVLVPVFFGDGYEPVITVLSIMSLLFVPIALNSTSSAQFFISTGRQNIYTRYVLYGGAVNVALNAVLIPKLMANGAAVASVAGEIVIMAFMLIYMGKNKHISVPKVFALSAKYLVAGAVMLASLMLVAPQLPLRVWSLCALIVGGAAIYFAVLLIEKEYFVFEGIKFALKFIKNKGKTDNGK
ncbi:MAG: flippase [Eubacterium sp.]|nr:flippase [Eubacterium sp.]